MDTASLFASLLADRLAGRQRRLHPSQKIRLSHVPRIIRRQDVEKELAARGCEKIKDYAFGTGSLWKTADGKFYFVVPQGIGGWAYEDVLRDILEMLSKR